MKKKTIASRDMKKTVAVDVIALTPDSLCDAWLNLRDEIAASDRTLSPVRAGELAAACLRWAISITSDEIEIMARRGRLTPAGEAFYDRIHVEEWSFGRQLEAMSGSRTMIADADSVVVRRFLDRHHQSFVAAGQAD